ncbi:hypothetical protein ACS0TY_032197 [Phlomoides rotata]
MEREKAQKRKREDDNITNESAKKQEYNCINKPHDDGIHGVFDFPWLKDGLVFKGNDDYLDEHGYKFSPPSYLHEAPENFDQSFSQNLCVSPTDLDANFFDTKLDDDGFWSLLVEPPKPVDDHEPVDCIWNCVIDQPLDMGFNKGL